MTGVQTCALPICILVVAGLDRRTGGVLDGLGRLEVGKPLRQVDGVMEPGQARHFAEDGIGKRRHAPRGADLGHGVYDALPAVRPACLTLLRSVQTTVVLRGPQDALHIVLRLGERDVVDEFVLRQAGLFSDRKSTRLNSSHMSESRMPSSA